MTWRLLVCITGQRRKMPLAVTQSLEMSPVWDRHDHGSIWNVQSLRCLRKSPEAVEKHLGSFLRWKVS